MAIVVGCDENGRLAEQAARNSELQASQNQEMARVHREVAAGAKRLVEADAEAQRQILQLQQGLQRERQQLTAAHQDLETERQRMAAQRQRDPMIAAAITSTGIVLACLLPLAIGGYVLHVTYGRAAEEELGEVLLLELASESPLLLPGGQPTNAAALPAPEGPALLEDDPPPF